MLPSEGLGGQCWKMRSSNVHYQMVGQTEGQHVTRTTKNALFEEFANGGFLRRRSHGSDRVAVSGESRRQDQRCRAQGARAAGGTSTVPVLGQRSNVRTSFQAPLRHVESVIIVHDPLRTRIENSHRWHSTHGRPRLPRPPTAEAECDTVGPSKRCERARCLLAVNDYKHRVELVGLLLIKDSALLSKSHVLASGCPGAAC
jgi:hypothetical protein